MCNYKYGNWEHRNITVWGAPRCSVNEDMASTVTGSNVMNEHMCTCLIRRCGSSLWLQVPPVSPWFLRVVLREPTVQLESIYIYGIVVVTKC